MEAKEIFEQPYEFAKSMFNVLLKDGKSDKKGLPKAGDFRIEFEQGNYIELDGKIKAVRVVDYQPNVAVTITFTPTKEERAALDEAEKRGYENEKEAERAALLARLAELDAEE